MKKENPPRVALLIESSTTWARSILDGINRYLRSSSSYWHLFIEPHGSNEDINLPRGWRGDGIIADIRSQAMAKHVAGSGLPVVNISQANFKGCRFATVSSNLTDCVDMAVDYYTSKGFRNLAYVRLARNAQDTRISSEFSDRVKWAGASYYSMMVQKRAWGVADWNLSTQKLADWLKGLPKPVGIFSWAIGREVVHACHEAGLKMPEDVSLLMLSDDFVFLEMSHIPISGIQHSGEEIGRLAANTLDDMMSNKKMASKRPQLFIQPLGVNTRQSSDILAITDPAMRKALAYIHDHNSRPLQVEEVAHHAGIARRTLEQRFMQMVGRSPAAYIRDEHLTLAKDLLKKTTLPIPRVAEGSGFTSPERLAQVFREKLGESPLKFRNRVTAR